MGAVVGNEIFVSDPHRDEDVDPWSAIRPPLRIECLHDRVELDVRVLQGLHVVGVRTGHEFGE